MHILSSMPRLKGFRFPREVVAYAVWTYHRFVNRPEFVGDHQLKERLINARCDAVFVL